tara:strand:+ start:1550 stop:2140 length:591 start_codon:yes stop_codon:yes gene_type:complete
MKNLITAILFILSTPFLPQAQENTDFYTFDMTDFLSDMQKDWSIGNGENPYTGEFEGYYFEVIVYEGMNFNNHQLEIMNSKITVIGDTINSIPIIKKYPDISELCVEEETLSIEDEPPQDRIEIIMYPNPADSEVTLRGHFMEKLTVYTIDGKKMIRANVRASEYTLDVSGYASGTYIVQIWMDSNKGIYKKLIIK